jgi:2,4-dichlorophenol 6-monooxygenase
MVAMGPKKFDRHSEEWVFHFAFQPNDPDFNEGDIVPRIRHLLRIPDLDIKVHKVSHWIVEAVLANIVPRRTLPDPRRCGASASADDGPRPELRHPGRAQTSRGSWPPCSRGQAGDGLLDSYEQERRPVAARNTRWALMTFMNHVVTDAGFGLIPGAPPELNAFQITTLMSDSDEGEWFRARADEVVGTQRMEFQAHDMELGFRYDGNAVVPDGTEPPPRGRMGDIYTPTTRPGHRLPHAWLEKGGSKLSTHDLCGRGRFVLITGAKGDTWKAAAKAAVERYGVPVDVVCVGAPGQPEDRSNTWSKLRQVEEEGAILVRPDVHVGWRCARAPADAAAALSDALGKILNKPKRNPMTMRAWQFKHGDKIAGLKIVQRPSRDPGPRRGSRRRTRGVAQLSRPDGRQRHVSRFAWSIR